MEVPDSLKSWEAWGKLYIGIMENQMETTIILGLDWDNGKENGNY